MLLHQATNASISFLMVNTPRLDRRLRSTKLLSLLALIGLAWWLFGNLYEAVVISPNWVVDSPAQLERLNTFFVNTDPTLYFIPVTVVGVLLLWVATFVGRHGPGARMLRIATIVSVALALLTAAIVALLVTKLFGEDYASYGDGLTAITWWWNGGNVLRMALTATTLVFVWRAHRELDRAAFVR